MPVRLLASLDATAATRRAAVAAIGVVGIALLLDWEVVACPFAELFALPCPGCGLTRAAWALLRGDFRAALALHPLSPVLVPVVAAALGRLLFRYVVGPPAPGASLRLRLGARSVDALFALLALALVGVWVARFLGGLGGPVQVTSRWHDRAVGAVMTSNGDKGGQATRGLADL